MKCPCGSGKNYPACCGLYIEGKEDPPTPEALMRSRYTAYSLGNLDYIEKTMCGEALENFDRSEAEEQDIEWLKLDILSSEEDEDRGTVQFIATFRYQDAEHLMQEISSFERIDGKWYYTKGVVS